MPSAVLGTRRAKLARSKTQLTSRGEHLGMRIYRKGDGWRLLFQLTGSAIPRSMLPGLFSAVVTCLIDVIVPKDYLREIFQHPYPFQPFAYITAFALVFRTNVAYNRFQEAASTDQYCFLSNSLPY